MCLMAIVMTLSLQDGIEEKRAKNGVTYGVRVPKGYTPRTGAPAIVWLHGSNMNALDYVETFVAMKWFPDCILIGIDGETGSKEKGHNYTFKSAKFIIEVCDEIAKDLKITKSFIGGHSQGGYVTYSVIMEYPERFAGAIPVSGGLWMECEPENYKTEFLEKQKKTAIAIVHGRADEVVEFGLAESAHFSYVDAAFPMIRLFDPKEGDHRFALLPVKEAIEWCDGMTDPKKAAAFADRMLKEKRYRDASVAGKIGKASGVLKQVETAAAAAAKPLAAKMSKAKDDSWVKEFWAFRQEFAFTDAARLILDAYARMRADHDKPAEDLFWKARSDFQKGDKEAGYRKYEEIVAKYYASKWYYYAKGSIEERKK